MSQGAPVRRLSPWRVILALFLLTGMVYGGFFGAKIWWEASSAAAYKSWFAAYVDVTSTPTFPFEQMGTTATKNVVLSFIVSSHTDPCIPSWGAAYSLDEARTNLDLDRRIARLHQQDGQIAVSFGGLLNDELAVKCTDQKRLQAAYKSVVERYQIDTIDLDLENNGLNDLAAGERRAQAIAALQQELRERGGHLAVWVTLPVAPYGMTQDGTNAVAMLLKNGVDLAGINVMTMAYGQSKAVSDSMAEASRKALNETHRQLGVLYQRAGINLSSKTLWTKIGATPMLGQNDVVEEVFTLQDAKEFNEFARAKGLGRMSMWSANRDIPCGENYVDVQVVSDSCSGVLDPKHSFAIELSAGFEGNLSSNASILTKDERGNNKQIVDDPKISPYQVWKESGAYLQGTKVVWHGSVYEAKWWTQGDLPDNPVLQAWETPWQLIGPVLPGEKPIEQPTLPKGTYPEWDGTVEYEAVQRVLFNNVPYQSKWWTLGDSPAAASANADSSPWVPLTQAQIKEILASQAAEKK